MLSKSTISKYDRFRAYTDKSLICHAPFVNLNFEQNGNITACCYNRKEVLGRYPQHSIADAWYGEAAETLRSYITQNDLRGGCSACGELLQAGNFGGTKALFYDEYAPRPKNPLNLLFPNRNRALKAPKVFELEISNTCNLECGMCSGYFSSTIRKNREGLPPLPMVYDAAFVEQLKEFMPGLTDMKFLGGEPFLIDLYYDIWEEIIRSNPDMRVHITTNGSVLNQRGKRILERLKVGIILSIDSLNPNTYPKIRVGASYERVMENLRYFHELTRKKNTYLTIAACPMVNNWQDLPELLAFTNREQINLHFNVVWTPEELSLQSLPATKLDEVIAYLKKNAPMPGNSTREKRNLRVYHDLISTLDFWLAEKPRQSFISDGWHADLCDLETKLPPYGGTLTDEIVRSILSQTGTHPDADAHTAFLSLKNRLQQLKLTQNPEIFNRHFLDALHFIYAHLPQGEPTQGVEEKMVRVKTILAASPKQEQLAQELTETHPLTQIRYIHENNLDLITKTLTARYA